MLINQGFALMRLSTNVIKEDGLLDKFMHEFKTFLN